MLGSLKNKVPAQMGKTDEFRPNSGLSAAFAVSFRRIGWHGRGVEVGVTKH
jgi:hypothetical protein